MAKLDNRADDLDDEGIDFMALLAPAFARKRLLLLALVVGGAVGVGASYLVKPKFTATNVFMPPQQQQSGALSALASLGALSGLANVGAKNSAEQYIALMQSAKVSDRIIAKFGLKALWDQRFDVDTRKRLDRAVQIGSDKKSSFIKVEVTDADPARAAAMANQYVEELRTITNELAVTEAQRRRVFFEHLLEQTRDKLAAAQTALEASGYSAGALNAEPRSAAEAYARIRAELTSAQVKLSVLRGSLADSAPAVQSAQGTVDALAAQLAKLESQDQAHAHSGDYVNRYREFKYQETLFDLFARQYEAARVDESREGALIQVVDAATPPEHKSSPKRSLYGAVLGLLCMMGTAGYLIRESRRRRPTPMDIGDPAIA